MTEIIETDNDIDPATGHTASQKKTGLTRRQVTKGAAWALPVIAIAVAAPAAAASTVQDYTIVFSIGTRTIGSTGEASVSATVPYSFTIQNNTATDIPAGTLIELTVADTTSGNPAPGLQLATVTGAGAGPGTGTLPGTTYVFPLTAPVTASGGSLMFAVTVVLGSGTVGDGTDHTWRTQVSVLDPVNIGSFDDTTVRWNGTIV